MNQPEFQTRTIASQCQDQNYKLVLSLDPIAYCSVIGRLMGQTHSNRTSNNKPIPQNNGSHKHSTRSKTDKKLLKIPTHTVPQPRNVSVQNVREPCFLKMPSLELNIYSIDPMIRKLFNRPKIRENSLS